MTPTVTLRKRKLVPPKRPRGRPRIYPFRDMDVGDAFYVTVDEGDTSPHLVRKLGCSIRMWRQRLPGRDWVVWGHDKKTGAPFVKDGVRRVKVWRIL